MNNVLGNGTICKLGLSLAPDVAIRWGGALWEASGEFGIRDPHHQALWLSLIMQSTSGLTRFEENFTGWTAEDMARAWPTRYAEYPRDPNMGPTEAARRLANNPRELANHLYHQRAGNEGPDDGWTFRPRYTCNLTGKWIYNQCFMAIGIPNLDDPDALLADIPGMARVGAWYWRTRCELSVSISGGSLDAVAEAWLIATADLLQVKEWHRRITEAMGV